MEIELLDSVSVAGSSSTENEDLIVSSNNLCVVLDGATGLGARAIKSYPSDAVWFVKAFSSRLVVHWRGKRDFVAAVSRSIEDCTSEYAKLTAGAARPPYELPSAGMVAIADESEGAYAYRLGDCTAYLKSGGNAHRIFERSPLADLDDRSTEALLMELRRGKSYRQARAAILPMLRAHRTLMNKPSGYGSLSLTPDCIHYLERHRVSCDEDTKLLLASDGFSVVERYFRYAASDIFDRCERLGINGVIEKIRALETEDEQMKTFPRLKPQDDATAVLLRLVPRESESTVSRI